MSMPSLKPLRDRIVAIALLTVLSACSADADKAPASPPRTVAATTAAVAQVDVEVGTLDGAAYRLDLPRAWNKRLVVFFHGYSIGLRPFSERAPLTPWLREFVARGYAVIQSDYSADGWALEQASLDSERLRLAFIARHGAPQETFAVGMSMGGMLTVMALETNATAYAGGLSFCGAIDSSDHLLQRDFALLAAFDFYFPDRIAAPLAVPVDFMPSPAVTQKIAAALREDPAAAESLVRIWGVGNEHTLADILAFDFFEIGEMQRRAHGNPFDNADFIYTGSNDDGALNRGVKRYVADAQAAAYLSNWYTANGRLTRPLLALHDIGDPLVPASSAFEYALLAQRSGRATNFVQQFVARDGHCAFTTQEVGQAFDELVDWVNDGKRPAPGPLAK